MDLNPGVYIILFDPPHPPGGGQNMAVYRAGEKIWFKWDEKAGGNAYISPIGDIFYLIDLKHIKWQKIMGWMRKKGWGGGQKYELHIQYTSLPEPRSYSSTFPFNVQYFHSSNKITRDSLYKNIYIHFLQRITRYSSPIQ